jgi:Protein of unknown function (DUF4011)
MKPEERTLEDVSLPDAVEGFTKRRVELVQRAVKEWTAALIDLGGRNNLLRYRDLKAGTLDLTSASPTALATLLQGKAIKTSTLFSDPDERARNARRLRTISNKARENFEERGLDTLALGCGLASWNNEAVSAWEPSAPVLLRQANLRPLGAAQPEPSCGRGRRVRGAYEQQREPERRDRNHSQPAAGRRRPPARRPDPRRQRGRSRRFETGSGHPRSFVGV